MKNFAWRWLLALNLLSSQVLALTLEEVADFRWDDVDTESVRQPFFAWQVATNGDWSVVAATLENNFQGQLYLFRFDPVVTTWRFERALPLPTDLASSCRLGESLTMDEEFIVAGSLGCGAFVYQRNRGGTNAWGYLRQLFADNTDDRRIQFQGAAVAISTDTIAVGAPDTDYAPFVSERTDFGLVLIYERNAGGTDNWGLSTMIDLPSTEQIAGAEFGRALSLDRGSLAVASSAYPSNDLSGSGRAWLFDRVNSAWVFRTSVTSDEPLSNAFFGQSIGLHGGVLVVGSTNGARDLTPAVSNDGSVYTFERDLGGADRWGLVEETVPTTPIGGFGESLSLDSNLMLVGSPDNGAGGAWLFERRNGLWVEAQSIQRPAFIPWFDFGFTVDLVRKGSRVHALIGDPLFEQDDSPELFTRLGKAFFYLYEDGLFADSFESL